MSLLERPVKLPLWVWPVLALLLLVYFGSPWTNYTQSRECQRICRAEGFADSYLYSSGRVRGDRGREEQGRRAH